MQKLSDEAKLIRQNGWKQCCFLKLEEPIVSKSPYQTIEAGIYIVINQNCDIQTPDLGTEPFIEVILCRIVEKADGNYTKGKNPRKLHIQIHKGTKKIYLECEAKNKHIINRNILTKLKPFMEFSLTKDTHNIFIRWVIGRYDRDYFPDSFNNRRDNKELQKILKNSHEDIELILISLNTEEELPDSKIYDVVLFLMVDRKISEENKQKVYEVLEKLIKILEQSSKIKVIDSDVFTLEQISADELLSMKKLDFDSLSYPNE